MKENTVELIDYLRVIWKRKIVMIVGILLCMAVVVGVSRTKFPDIYHAETLIQIGKVLTRDNLFLTSSPNYKLIDTPERLQTNIPIIYALGIPGYTLDAVGVLQTSILRIIVEGPNGEKVDKLLKGVVDRITESHAEKLEYFIEQYSVCVAEREEDIKKTQKSIYALETGLKAMNASNVDLDKENQSILKRERLKVQTQNYLWLMRKDLRLIRQQQLEYETVVDCLEYNNSKVVSMTEASKIIMRSKVGKNVLIGGAVGLMISICVAFMIEYLVMEKKKARGEVNR
jgi:hypothetical protein